MDGCVHVSIDKTIDKNRANTHYKIQLCHHLLTTE
jgi:hypothetical protein